MVTAAAAPAPSRRLLALVCCCFALLACPAAAQHDGGHGGMAMPMMTADAGPRPACVENPTAANCTAFRLPHRVFQSNTDSLCKAMHFMPGCSVYKACRAAAPGVDATEGNWTAKVSAKLPAVCRRVNLIATVCSYDEGMSKMAGCQANYNSLCGTKGSVVELCKNYTGHGMLPTTKMLNAAVRELCLEDRKRPGCALCLPSIDANKTYANCDLLATWGEICAAEPSESKMRWPLAPCLAFPSPCLAPLPPSPSQTPHNRSFCATLAPSPQNSRHPRPHTHIQPSQSTASAPTTPRPAGRTPAGSSAGPAPSR